MALKTQQVEAQIMELIENAQPGDKIMPELEMTKEFDASKVTVRRALKKLVEKKYLYRVQGRGTFIDKNIKMNLHAPVQKIGINDICCTPSINENDRNYLRFSFCENSASSSIYEQLAAKFREKEPRFQISLDSRTKNSNHTPSYYSEIERGVIPDIFHIFPHQIEWFARNSVIKELDKLNSNSPFWELNDLNQNIRDAITFHGKIWMLPKGINVYCLYYNKKLFREEGIPFPDETWNWQTYLEAAIRLSKDTDGDGVIDQYGSVYFRDYQAISMLLWAHGADFINERGEVILDSPEAMDVFKYGFDLTEKHKTTLPSSHWQQGKQFFDLFNSGKLAMQIVFGPSSAQLLSQDLDWDVAVVPFGPAGRFSPFASIGYAISSRTQHPQEAWEFIKLAAGIDGVLKFAEIGNDLPSFKNTAALSTLLHSNQKPESSASYLVMTDCCRNYLFNGAYWPFIYQDFNRLMDEIYIQKKSIESAVQAAKRRMQKSMCYFMNWRNGQN